VENAYIENIKKIHKQIEKKPEKGKKK